MPRYSTGSVTKTPAEGPAPAEAPTLPVVQEFLSLYPDAHRITAALSATGQGTHLRWHYSQSGLDAATSSGFTRSTPNLSSAWSSRVSASNDKSPDVDGSRIAKEPFTPMQGSSYEPGSVIQTPTKRAAPLQHRSGRAGNHRDWWHADMGGVGNEAMVLPEGARSGVYVPDPHKAAKEAQISKQQYEKLVRWTERNDAIYAEMKADGVFAEEEEEGESEDSDVQTEHTMDIDGGDAIGGRPTKTYPLPSGVWTAVRRHRVNGIWQTEGDFKNTEFFADWNETFVVKGTDKPDEANSQQSQPPPRSQLHVPVPLGHTDTVPDIPGPSCKRAGEPSSLGAMPGRF